MKSIKDLIYFDLEKARSLSSQLKGGLISEISRAFEDEAELNSGLGFDLKVIKGNVFILPQKDTIIPFQKYTILI